MSSRFGVLAARRAEDEESAAKGRVSNVKTKRYWAGKAPEWLAQEQIQGLQLGEAQRGEATRTEVAAPVIVRKADPRLARLAASRITGEDAEDVRSRHREIRSAEIVQQRRREQQAGEEEGGGGGGEGAARRRPAAGDGAGGSSSSEEEEGEEGEGGADDVGGDQNRRSGAARHAAEEEEEGEALKRRQAVRERLIQQQRASEAAQQQQGEDEEEEEEEESEYETDSEDEAQAGRRLLKPVFVPKESRETIAERDRLEQEEQEAEEREKRRAEERKIETRQIVAEHIAAEAQAARQGPEGVQQNGGELEDVNTDDENDQVDAFETWKGRELLRIGREREEREKQVAEAAERERLKNMTDEERRQWERDNPKVEKPKQKEKWRFLQKYWHKGAFFQEDADDERGTTAKDAIFDRDYSAPTGEDKFNKEILPKVMQVRNFGRSGRTKWTHLLDEDTTNYDDPAIKMLGEKRRAGGSAEEFSKPKKFKS